MQKRSRPRPVQTDPIIAPAQIRALASPARQDIVDTVQALGAASVPELAAQLGRPADALYYHVRALVRSGLLVVTETRRRGRHDEAVYATRAPDRRLMLSYRPGKPVAARTLGKVVASMQRAAKREFDAAIADPACVVEGPARELWAGRAKGWLAAAELRQANALLLELMRVLSTPRSSDRGRLFSFQFVLAPARTSRKAPNRAVRPSRAAATRARRATKSTQEP